MRFLLAFFFFFMYMGDDLGLNISLGPGVSTKNLLLYVILVGIAVNSAVARNRHFDLASVVTLFALLILYAVLTWIMLAFVLDRPFYKIRGAFIALKSDLVDQFITFLIFFYGLIRLPHALWLLRATIWIVLLGNFVTIVDTLNMPNLGILNDPRDQGRFEGFLGQSNNYGQFLVLFLPASVALCSITQGNYRRVAWIATGASLMALILTGSRGAYVGLIFGSVLATVFLRKCISVAAVAKFCALAVVVGGAAVAITTVLGYGDVYLDRLFGIQGTSHNVTSGRTTIWKTAIEPMIQNPITFFTGFGFFAYESGFFLRSTHNTYLSYLYNLGIIGLSLFIGLFSRVLSVARCSIGLMDKEQKIQTVAFVYGLFGFLIAIFFSEYQVSGYLLWAYVGVTLRMVFATQLEATNDRSMRTMSTQVSPREASPSGEIADARH